ncbi:hypothetical protein PLICRDRAFT_700591 [Plicaturopsis crispa FD-325 SS-3]|nr:hypothetical protein PLICRDRAFT_700591 [Plicaturopsis crispa FD-325 SS-3]
MNSIIHDFEMLRGVGNDGLDSMPAELAATHPIPYDFEIARLDPSLSGSGWGAQSDLARAHSPSPPPIVWISKVPLPFTSRHSTRAHSPSPPSVAPRMTRSPFDSKDFTRARSPPPPGGVSMSRSPFASKDFTRARSPPPPPIVHIERLSIASTGSSSRDSMDTLVVMQQPLLYIANPDPKPRTQPKTLPSSSSVHLNRDSSRGNSKSMRDSRPGRSSKAPHKFAGPGPAPKLPQQSPLVCFTRIDWTGGSESERNARRQRFNIEISPMSSVSDLRLARVPTTTGSPLVSSKVTGGPGPAPELSRALSSRHFSRINTSRFGKKTRDCFPIPISAM